MNNSPTCESDPPPPSQYPNSFTPEDKVMIRREAKLLKGIEEGVQKWFGQEMGRKGEAISFHTATLGSPMAFYIPYWKSCIDRCSKSQMPGLSNWEQQWKEDWAGMYSHWIDINVTIIHVLPFNFSEFPHL